MIQIIIKRPTFANERSAFYPPLYLEQRGVDASLVFGLLSILPLSPSPLPKGISSPQYRLGETCELLGSLDVQEKVARARLVLKFVRAAAPMVFTVRNYFCRGRVAVWYSFPGS